MERNMEPGPDSGKSPSSTPQGPIDSAQPSGRIRWRESWILRVSLAAVVIVALALAVSGHFAWSFLTGVARTTHLPEVEQVLESSADNLRQLHSARQALLVERLRPRLMQWRLSSAGRPTLDDETLRQWLVGAGASDLGDLAGLKIVDYQGDSSSEQLPSADTAGNVPDPELNWLDRSHLRVGPKLVELPPGELFADFSRVEDVRKRYQLIGMAMHERVLAEQLKLQSYIALSAFALLVLALTWFARSFRGRLSALTKGFATWAEDDAKFRFDKNWRGELRLITEHFNRMADDVAANRARTLYLEKIASWQVMARKLAHEIKNPLTPIQMMVSQLARRYQGDDAEFSRLLTDAHTIVSEEVTSLRRMVDSFSSFASLPEPVLAPVDLVELGRQIVELERAAHTSTEIRFQPGKFAKLVVRVDDHLLRQVLINLIKNAVEATAAGSGASTVTLRIAQTNSRTARIEVEDNGPGIPEEIRARLFEAYVTTKHTGPSPGMGLGLAICQKIVIDHGGTISVESEPGRTRFTIQLRV